MQVKAEIEGEGLTCTNVWSGNVRKLQKDAGIIWMFDVVET